MGIKTRAGSPTTNAANKDGINCPSFLLPVTASARMGITQGGDNNPTPAKPVTRARMANLAIDNALKYLIIVLRIC